MLCRVVGEVEDNADQAWIDPPSSHLSVPDYVHPWTGTSSRVFGLFASAISLCRRFRVRSRRHHAPTTKLLQKSLRDIEDAQSLEKQLELLELRDVSNVPPTDDELTPRSDLVNLAEAYRLSALLHLRQTFPDLVADSHGWQTAANEQDQVGAEPQRSALEIINVLDRIPATSGTQAIQPLLYLSASTGLKFDVPVCGIEDSSSLVEEILGCGLATENSSIPGHSPQLDEESSKRDTPKLTTISIQVGQARRFVLERLGMLEHHLPSKPTRITKQLVQAIWDAYDKEGPSSNQAHWIDIMNDTGLRTMFG